MPHARRTAPTVPAPPRTPAQNRRIWALLRQLGALSGLSREELEPTLRAACQAESGQEHSRTLTAPQAERVLARLQREVATYAPAREARRPKPAPHAPWGPRSGPRGELAVTAFQGVVLNGLFGLVGYDLRGRRAFCERQTGKSWPTTQQEADAVITPLSAMALRHIDRDDVVRRLDALSPHKLDRWKTGFVADLRRQLDEKPGKTALSPHKLIKLLECEAAAGVTP